MTAATLGSAQAERVVHAMAWSGGKDSMLALDRLVRDGRDVRFLFNLYDCGSRRVRFHGVRRELIQRQAERLGLTLIQLSTGSGDFEAVFFRGLERLRELGATAIAFGNIHLADVRLWYEERTTARGFAHVEPLWGSEPRRLVEEFIARKYGAILTSVDLERARREWLGRSLDAGLCAEIGTTPGVDAAGESGEFHTFVCAGPMFRSSIAVTLGGVYEAEGHALVDLME
jgi:uncharacterized protein (TIGR00290 family)